MNAPLLPQILLRQEAVQTEIPLATEAVLRYVWQGRFGEMLIEVLDGVAYVNGQRVQPAENRAELPVDRQPGASP